ncbi:MAG: PorT family protein [Cyclobacteriaceae bacterium]|nr:PorT family protein [Cyclobacteriaceae bacterium]
MKNSILKTLILSCILLAGISAKAQEKTWSVGPEVGLSLSKYGGDAGSNDLKSGAVGGLFLTYSIKNTFGITGKVLYYQKGAYVPDLDLKQTLNYIEVPIIGRYFLIKEGNFRPNIFLGPSFNFLTGVTNKVGTGDRVSQENWDSVYNSFDLGITGGAGLNFLIASETYFIIDARYTHGFSDLTKPAGVINNNSIAITAGISFGF